MLIDGGLGFDAEHFGAMARMQGWKDELSAPPPSDAAGLR